MHPGTFDKAFRVSSESWLHYNNAPSSGKLLVLSRDATSLSAKDFVAPLAPTLLFLPHRETPEKRFPRESFGGEVSERNAVRALALKHPSSFPQPLHRLAQPTSGSLRFRFPRKSRGENGGTRRFLGAQDENAPFRWGGRYLGTLK